MAPCGAVENAHFQARPAVFDLADNKEKTECAAVKPVVLADVHKDAGLPTRKCSDNGIGLLAYAHCRCGKREKKNRE